MACALPLVNLIAFGLSMQMATDSATYCMLFDSTMMAADTLLKYNCWGEDSTAYYTAYFDSMETAGCDWQEIDIVGQWDGISLCIYADAENCSGDCPTLGTCWVDGQMIESDDSTSCIVNGGIWENNTPDFSLVINENGTISELSDCDCDSYSDDCDEEAADAATDLTSCTAVGGEWHGPTCISITTEKYSDGS